MPHNPGNFDSHFTGPSLNVYTEDQGQREFDEDVNSDDFRGIEESLYALQHDEFLSHERTKDTSKQDIDCSLVEDTQFTALEMDTQAVDTQDFSQHKFLASTGRTTQVQDGLMPGASASGLSTPLVLPMFSVPAIEEAASEFKFTAKCPTIQNFRFPPQKPKLQDSDKQVPTAVEPFSQLPATPLAHTEAPKPTPAVEVNPVLQNSTLGDQQRSLPSTSPRSIQAAQKDVSSPTSNIPQGAISETGFIFEHPESQQAFTSRPFESEGLEKPSRDVSEESPASDAPGPGHVNTNNERLHLQKELQLGIGPEFQMSVPVQQASSFHNGSFSCKQATAETHAVRLPLSERIPSVDDQMKSNGLSQRHSGVAPATQAIMLPLVSQTPGWEINPPFPIAVGSKISSREALENLPDHNVKQDILRPMGPGYDSRAARRSTNKARARLKSMFKPFPDVATPKVDPLRLKEHPTVASNTSRPRTPAGETDVNDFNSTHNLKQKFLGDSGRHSPKLSKEGTILPGSESIMNAQHAGCTHVELTSDLEHDANHGISFTAHGREPQIAQAPSPTKEIFNHRSPQHYVHNKSPYEAVADETIVAADDYLQPTATEFVTGQQQQGLGSNRVDKINRIHPAGQIQQDQKLPEVNTRVQSRLGQAHSLFYQTARVQQEPQLEPATRAESHGSDDDNTMFMGTTNIHIDPRDGNTHDNPSPPRFHNSTKIVKPNARHNQMHLAMKQGSAVFKTNDLRPTLTGLLKVHETHVQSGEELMAFLSEFEEQQKVIQSQKSQISQLETSYRSSTEKIDGLRSQKKDLVAKTQKLYEMAATYTKYFNEVAKLQKWLKAKSINLDSATKEAQQLLLHRKAVEERIKGAIQEARDLRAYAEDFAAVEQERHVLESQKKKVIVENEKLKAANIQSQLSQQKLEGNNSLLEVKAQKLEIELHKLEADNQRLVSDNYKLELEFQRVEGQNQNLETDCRNLVNDKERLGGENQTLNAENKKLSFANQKLQSDFSAATRSAQLLQDDLSRVITELSTEKHRCETLMIGFERQSAAHQEIVELMKQAPGRMYHELSRENGFIIKVIEAGNAIQAKIDKVASSVSTANTIAPMPPASLVKLLEDVCSRIENATQAYNTNEIPKQETNAKLLSHIKESIEQLRSRTDAEFELTTKIAELGKANEDLRTNKFDLERRFELLALELDQNKRNLTESRAQLGAKSDELAATRAAPQGDPQDKSKIQELESTINGLKTQVDDARQGMSELKLELSTALEACHLGDQQTKELRHNINDAQTKISKFTLEMEKLGRDKDEEKRKECERLARQAHTQEESVKKKLEAEVNLVDERFREKATALDMANNQLQSVGEEIKAKTGEIDRLKTEAAKYIAQFTQQNALVKQLQIRVSELEVSQGHPFQLETLRREALELRSQIDAMAKAQEKSVDVLVREKDSDDKENASLHRHFADNFDSSRARRAQNILKETVPVASPLPRTATSLQMQKYAAIARSSSVNSRQMDSAPSQEDDELLRPHIFERPEDVLRNAMKNISRSGSQRMLESPLHKIAIESSGINSTPTTEEKAELTLPSIRDAPRSSRSTLRKSSMFPKFQLEQDRSQPLLTQMAMSARQATIIQRSPPLEYGPWATSTIAANSSLESPPTRLKSLAESSDHSSPLSEVSSSEFLQVKFGESFMSLTNETRDQRHGHKTQDTSQMRGSHNVVAPITATTGKFARKMVEGQSTKYGSSDAQPRAETNDSPRSTEAVKGRAYTPLKSALKKSTGTAGVDHLAQVYPARRHGGLALNKSVDIMSGHSVPQVRSRDPQPGHFTKGVVSGRSKSGGLSSSGAPPFPIQNHMVSQSQANSMPPPKPEPRRNKRASSSTIVSAKPVKRVASRRPPRTVIPDSQELRGS